MRYPVVLAGLLVLSPGSVVQAADVLTLGKAFCAARLADDEQATRALLTRSLIEVIDEAERRSAVIAEAAPDEKPPLGDGIPYQAFPDAVGSCDAGKAVEQKGFVELAVTYGFADAPETAWTDRIKIVEEGDAMRIDNIVYASVANGEPDLNLRRLLAEAFDQ